MPLPFDEPLRPAAPVWSPAAASGSEAESVRDARRRELRAQVLRVHAGLAGELPTPFAPPAAVVLRRRAYRSWHALALLTVLYAEILALIPSSTFGALLLPTLTLLPMLFTAVGYGRLASPTSWWPAWAWKANAASWDRVIVSPRSDCAHVAWQTGPSRGPPGDYLEAVPVMATQRGRWIAVADENGDTTVLRAVRGGVSA